MGDLIEDMTAFTCSVSSFFRNPGLYTGEPENILKYNSNGWITERGKARNAWIKIEFNSMIALSQVQVQQPCSIFEKMFKEVKLSFSNSPSQNINLPKKRASWSSAKISPVIHTSFITITAVDYYNPENLNSSRYGICRIQFFGQHLPERFV